MGGAPGMQGNPYMPNSNMAQQKPANPYMSNNMPQNNPPAGDQLFNPFKENGPVKTDNPYMQGNPYAGFGINQGPAQNNTAPLGQNTAVNAEPVPGQFQPVNNTGAGQPANDLNTAQPGPADSSVAEQSKIVLTKTDDAAASGPAIGESNVSGPAAMGPAISESNVSGPAPMGPLSDDRPAPSPMGELKTQMPNTAPNPFLQNLENLKKDTDDTNNT